jgi:hypothetical protein
VLLSANKTRKNNTIYYYVQLMSTKPKLSAPAPHVRLNTKKCPDALTPPHKELMLITRFEASLI